MAAQPVTARYSTLHNGSMAAASVAMVVVAIVHFINNPAKAPNMSLNDQGFVLFVMLSAAVLYYAVLGINRIRNREPQVVIDHDGIRLGFGRNSRFTWDDIIWVRLRRLALRPQLEIGLADQAFISANLRLTMWSFDDSLRPVRGQPTTVLVRDNGLDTKASAMLDAVKTFRPNLVKS
ncbi:hypothetical protein SAMN02990966_06523 [Rhodospirillales bacterium URHD0017]|nr:hypothetical protein SAMN02990966_06523 [Rhodospirillales bacterium URHD0017]